MNIDFPIQLDILDFIFKGIAIGIIASAPMGPVGILCIQRTLNKGRWYGLMTGVGAAVSDIIYALIVGLGMGFIMEPLQIPSTSSFSRSLVALSCCFLVSSAFVRTRPRRCLIIRRTKVRDLCSTMD